MKIMSPLIKLVVFAAEKIFSELALLAAIFSMMFSGEIGARVARGMLYNFRALYAFGRAYALDVGFDQFIAGFKTAVLEAIDRSSANIKADPRTVFLTLLCAYMGFKVAAILLRIIRKKLLCKRCVGESAHRPEKGPIKKGHTYEQLYDELGRDKGEGE